MRWLWLLLALLVTPAEAATQFTDIACETTATTGTGTINLAGAKSGGYLGFAAAGITSGNSVPYSIVTGSGATRKLETGLGTFTDGSPDTLTRVADWSSDGAGSELNLSGTSTVCIGWNTASFADEDKGDITTSNGFKTWTIDPNSVALGTDTTGNYADGDAEGGAATSGDSATSFFSTGTIEDARIDGSAEADEVNPTLGTQTQGNYALGDAEGGAATTGDSATAFFSSGTIEDARIDGSAEADEVNPTLGTQTQGNYALGDGEGGNATTGDSATAFFSTGTIEDARIDGSAEADEVLNSDKGDFTCAAGTCALDADVVNATEIQDGTVSEADLKVVDTPNDEECLEYESTTGDFEWEACGSGGATTALDNLASVAINTSLTSDTDNTDDLGTAAIGWKDAHVRNTEYAGDTGSTHTCSGGECTIEGDKIKQAGKQTIWVPASSMTPRVTSGCVPATRETNSITIKTCDFPDAADSGAIFSIALPKRWNASTLTFQYVWTASAATATETTAMELSCGSFANDAAINSTGLGTAVEVSDAVLAANDVHISAESGAITVSNAADDTLLYCLILRDTSEDTHNDDDIELLGLKLYFTDSAANDD